MRIFGLVADFRMEHGRIGVSCRLSHSGQIRFLDMKHKFDVLDQIGQSKKASPAEPAAPVRPAKSEASIVLPATGTSGNVVTFRSRESSRLASEHGHGLGIS